MNAQITNLLSEPTDLALPLSQLGEGTHFDLASHRLFWVDIDGKTVHVLNVFSKAHSSWTLTKKVTFAVPIDGKLLLCLEDGVYDYEPQTGEERAIATLRLPRDHRLNDGKVSPEGRLWVGTIDTSDHRSETAGLFVLDDNNLELVESGYENANGKAWNADGTIMYHADTARSVVAVPVPNPTSCTIVPGEPNILYITTAYDGMDDDERAKYPLAGAIFTADLSAIF